MERTALLKAVAACSLLAVGMFVGIAGAQVNAHGVRAAPVMFDPTPHDFHIPPPPEVKLQQKGLMLSQATVTVSFLTHLDLAPFGDGVSDYCSDADPQAEAAFNFAASIWASQLQSSVPIHIQACFAHLGPSVLGEAGPTTFYQSFTGAPMTATWYPKALANALHGSDLNSSLPDIQAEFSNDYTWYYGTDGNAGGNIDLVSVILHELGHGLGFLGSAQMGTPFAPAGQGSWGQLSGLPFIWDRHTENGTGQSIINTSIFPNPSITLATALVSPVFFTGTHANAANGGAHVALFSPNPWQDGSSYSHLAESFNGTPNALMTYAIGPGESQHAPGPVMLGIFQDMGWQLQTASTADLALTQTVSTNPASSGKDAVFTMSLVNNGPGTATGVTVYAAYDATATVIWVSPGCAPAGAGLYACTVGSLANAATRSFKLVLRKNAAGSMYNNAGVSSATTDPNAANNSANVAITVNTSPAASQVLRYRLYSPGTQEHLYTTDLNEYNVLGAGGWSQEGTVGKVLNQPGAFNAVTATPYYRLYNTTSHWHHWTTDPNEYYTLIQGPPWNGEGVDGYILPTATTGTEQLYRLLYPDGRGLHHWTIDAVEYGQLISVFGWIGEGGSGFVIQ